jgi:hypothetical protein
MTGRFKIPLLRYTAVLTVTLLEAGILAAIGFNYIPFTPPVSRCRDDPGILGLSAYTAADRFRSINCTGCRIISCILIIPLVQ